MMGHVWKGALTLFLLCFGAGFAAENLKTVVVTCASGGLGSAAARGLASDYNLILTGRNLSTLEQLQKELEAAHPWRYEISLLDYSSNDSIATFKEFLEKTNAPLSGLVLIPPRPQFEGKSLLQKENTWLEAFQNGFTGPLEALQAVLPYLAKPSKIVVIAGTTSVQFQPDSGPACVLRRMWATCTKALSHQLGPQGIYVNTLSPGVIMTSFHQNRIEAKARENGVSYDEQMEQEVLPIPLRRNGEPQDVAHAIKFLLSEESNFINGVNLVIDGGFTAVY